MNGWREAWALARRDLHPRFRGLRLLLLCLALGVGALAAIGSLSASVQGELAARGQVILGGDVEFAAGQRGPTEEERRLFRSLGRVSETVRMQANAIRADGGGAAPVQLKGVDRAYPLYGALILRGGRRVGAPPPDQVWIAPNLAERLRVRVGDRLRFGTALFIVGGVIAEEPDRLGEGFTLGPVALMSSEGVRRTGLVQPGSLFETKVRLALPPGQGVEGALAEAEAGLAEGAWEVKTRDRAAPGATRFLDRMGEFLTLVGLAALAIAGIGVGNGVSAYLRARRGAIATLKILGATSGLIARTYLLQVLVVASLGIAIGLLLGAVATPVAVALAGDALPVRPGFRFHPAPLGIAALFGLLVALAFCIRPLADAGAVPAAGLLRGQADARRAPVRRWALPVAVCAAGVIALGLLGSDRPLWALAFGGAAAGLLLLLSGLGWLIGRAARALPRPKRPMLRLGVAALGRPGAQTGALVVALGLGLSLFVLLAGIRSSLDANIGRNVPARAPAMFALDLPPERESEFRATIRAVAPAADVRTVPLLRGTITAYGGTRVAELAEIPDGAWALRGERGLTYAAAVPPGSEIVAGRWWPRGHQGPALVSVDEELARALALRIGDPLTVSVLGVEKTARVAAFRRINWDTLGFNFVLVFSPNMFNGVPHNLSATIDVPPGQEGRVTNALLPRFPSVSVVEVRGVLGQVRDVLDQMATAIGAATAVVLFAGLAVLLGAIAATREARTYDGVITKVLGATRWQVLGAQAVEYLILAAVLALLALGVGAAGAWAVVTQLFELAWLPDWGAVGAVLAGGVALVLLFGLGGALPTLSVRPARALRQL